MSTVKANNVQVGQSGTATNNFTLYQPSTPDGTVRLAVGNSGATTGDVLSVSNTGLSVTGTLSATGNVSFNGGTFVFNESGADKDFRIEGDTDANLFFTDASTDRVGIGTSSPQSLLNTASTGQVQIGTSSWPTSFIGKSNARTIIGNEGVLILWNEAAATAGNEAALYIGPKGSGTNGSTIIAGGYVKGISESSSTNNGALTFGTNSGGGNSEKMRIDSSGNLGLGVTPSAWNAAIRAVQLCGTSSTGTATLYSNGANGGIVQNAIFDTGWKYVASAAATRYDQTAGTHAWSYAASGTAGATTSITSGQVYTVTTLGSTLGQWQAYFSGLSSIPSIGQSITATATGTLAGGATVTQTITFTQAMTLDASGNLALGHTSATSRLDVRRGDTDGLIAEFHQSGGYGVDIGSSQSVAYVSSGYLQALTFKTDGGSGQVERVRIGSGGEVYFPGVGTTASAANAFLNNGSTPANQLLRSTSSLRYKTDVETLDHVKADAVLNLRPVWYRSKAEADRKDWSWYGLIAEEVAQVEPRLVHWSYPEDQFETIETQTEIEKTREVEVTPAVLDDEGNVVEPAVTETETYTETETKSERKLKTDAQLAPDGVQYDRLTVMLLDIVKRQNQRIEQLEAKVAALEAQ